MDLTKKERLLLSNQYEILSQLAEDDYDANKYRNLGEIYRKGYTSYYDYYDEIGEELSNEECRFVIDVIDMYDWFYYSWQNLSDEEKKENEFETFMFNGFDVNDNVEVRFFSFAEFLLNDMQKWNGFINQSVVGKNLNSHGFGKSVLELERMLVKFNEVKKSGKKLTLADMLEILDA